MIECYEKLYYVSLTFHYTKKKGKKKIWKISRPLKSASEGGRKKKLCPKIDFQRTGLCTCQEFSNDPHPQRAGLNSAILINVACSTTIHFIQVVDARDLSIARKVFPPLIISLSNLASDETISDFRTFRVTRRGAGNLETRKSVGEGRESLGLGSKENESEFFGKKTAETTGKKRPSFRSDCENVLRERV